MSVKAEVQKTIEGTRGQKLSEQKNSLPEHSEHQSRP